MPASLPVSSISRVVIGDIDPQDARVATVLDTANVGSDTVNLHYMAQLLSAHQLDALQAAAATAPQDRVLQARVGWPALPGLTAPSSTKVLRAH